MGKKKNKKNNRLSNNSFLLDTSVQIESFKFPELNKYLNKKRVQGFGLVRSGNLNSGHKRGDGTVDRTHKLKLSELSEVAIVDGREIIKAKVKGSMSKAMRFKIQKQFEKDTYTEIKDFEEYYKNEMTELMTFIDAKIESLENGFNRENRIETNY